MRGDVQWVVVIDATPSENSAKANKTFSLAADASGTAEDALWRILDSLCPSPIDPATQVDEAVGALKKIESDLAKATTHRWISGKSDRVLVYVFHEKEQKAKITFAESTRASRIATDLTTLIGILPDFAGRALAPQFAVTTKVYALELNRGTLAVSAALSAAKNPSTATDGNAGPTPKPAPAKPESGADVLGVSLITGPREHLFLSADAGITSAKQISYDDNTRSLGPAKAPKEFFIGGNYALGDLYQDAGSNWARLRKSLFIGALLEGSSQPFNQVGAVLGFRYLPFVTDFLAFDSVSPYAGIVWVQDESLEGAGAQQVVRRHYGQGHAVFGLSLNLSKASGWIGGGDGSTK